MAYGTVTVGATIYTAPSGSTILSLIDQTFNDAAAAEWVVQRVNAPNGVAVNIDTDSLVGAVITTLIVKNTDAANEVDLTWTDNDANANTQVIPPLSIAVIPDVDASTDPTLEGQGGIVPCDVFYMGT